MNEMKPEDVYFHLEQYPESRLKRNALALLREKDAVIERLIKERDEVRRDVAVAERKHYESEKEVEGLKYFLDCYALQYGTTRDKEYFLNKAREEAITEFAERLTGRFNVGGKAMYSETTVHNVIERVAEDMKEGQDG